MKKINCLLLALIALLGDSAWQEAEAQVTYFTEYAKTVKLLGTQGLGFYASFAEPLNQSCSFGLVYISPDRKGMYTQLLTAKLTGRKISRLDYSQPGGTGTQCNAEIIELMD